MHADLADRDALEAMAAEVERQVPSLDILVNNAGDIARHPAEKFPLEDWDRVLRTNLDAAWILSQRFGGQMIARGSGKIINTASVLRSAAGSPWLRTRRASMRSPVSPRRSPTSALQRAGQRDRAGLLRHRQHATAAKIQHACHRSTRASSPAASQPADLAGAVVFLASDAANYVNGQPSSWTVAGWLAEDRAMHRLPDPERARTLGADDLRAAFLVRLFTAGRVTLRHVDLDRAILGGQCRSAKRSAGSAGWLAAEHFLERREMGVLNVGGPGRAAGTSFELQPRDASSRRGTRRRSAARAERPRDSIW